MSTSTDPRTARRASTVAGLLALMIMAAHVPVSAAVSEADADSAKKLYAEGVKLEPTDLPTARDRFKGAFKLRPSPIIGLKLGEVHERLGELVEARQVYRRSETVKADEFLDVGVKEESQNAKDARKEAGRRADALEHRIPSITIRLENIPKGALPKVSVDDADIPIEALAVPRSVNPGKHVVLVKLEGQPAKKSAFELAEGKTRVVTVDLTPDAPATSTVPAESGPKAVPAVPPPAAPTPSPGHSDVATSGPSALTWVGFGVGAAGIVVGSVTGILALGKDSTVKDNCPNQGCPPAFHDDLDAAKRFSTISTISFAVGLIGVGVGVWGLLSSPSPTADKTHASTSVRPSLGIGTIGITGAF